jgi:hypothetical protein
MKEFSLSDLASETVIPFEDEMPFMQMGPSQGGPEVNPFNDPDPLVDLVPQDPSTMTTWQNILTEIVIIQRLERDSRRGSADIVRMIQAANTVAALAPQLVEDMKEHRNKLLRDLGVEPPKE